MNNFSLHYIFFDIFKGIFYYSCVWKPEGHNFNFVDSFLYLIYLLDGKTCQNLSLSEFDKETAAIVVAAYK